MKDLGLVGISSAELSALAITEELGKMHLAAALADTLCAMFVDSNAGISTVSSKRISSDTSRLAYDDEDPVARRDFA
jgi:hypothetical protein